MKISPTLHRLFIKLSVLAALSILVSSSALAQVSLRRALDYDGDGKADPAVFRPSNNVWYIQKSAGGNQFTNFGVASTDIFTPGDYDGDGKGDIAVWRDTDGTFYFLRSSTGTFGAVQWGVTGDEPVSRNWDGAATSATEFAVVRRTGGSMFWYIRLANGGLRAVQFGLTNDYVAPGDYDGDGIFDVAVQRGTDNNGPATFYYASSQNNNALVAVQWGLSNDFVAPGDYDGDGKTDIAVVREISPNLIWYIRRSGSATPGELLAFQFGTNATDLIAQNDYDGDNITDVAVWRDTNGTFYIRKSTDGSLLGIQWGASSDFPIASYDTH